MARRRSKSTVSKPAKPKSTTRKKTPGITTKRPKKVELPPPTQEHVSLETKWLQLTRVTMPAAARAHKWPVYADHCFQRILLDNAFGGCWYEFVKERPAYRYIDAGTLSRAVRLGEDALEGKVDLDILNHASLEWRGKTK